MKRTVMIALVVTAAILAALAMIPAQSAPETVGPFRRAGRKPVPQCWKESGDD